ncbi:hypothetical protein C8J57DRAFT_1439079 [Mycena rebaudengoi]|nr:hypothetical protein C8J57DRAFT_1439079 [Mycena rebaudengoi]
MWVEDHRQEYLEETLRSEGRGDPCNYEKCVRCGKPDPTFRCEGQLCYGPGMSCKSCIIASHAALPTHWVEEWNGKFFERQSLAELGLVMQLGHPVGYGCPASLQAHQKFVVIDTTGVHVVALRFCECDSRISHWQQLMHVCWWPATARDPQTCATFAIMRLFERMSCLGKITGYDFLRSLELLTNGDGLTPPPSRRHAFMYIASGRGHANSGIAGTAQGELALRCRACPQPGVNMPTNWKMIDCYKYALFLATDCNFRLINCNVSSEAKDPIVDDRLGFFVNHADYTKFLRNYVSEEKISSCSGFQAMFLANMKHVRGLRTMGVGGVTCARHNMWRPNGMGNLQLGERFSLLDSLLEHLVLFKKFWERMKKFEPRFHLDMDEVSVWYKVPNFHLPPHKPSCHSPYSFHFMRGAGRMHGETVEQNWEFTNGAAASSKMMGPGARAAALEYLLAFHNWRRTVSYRQVLYKQLAEDVREGQIHREAFEALDGLLEEQDAVLVGKWRAWVSKWEAVQHTDESASPYELKVKIHTLKDVQLKLAKEELLRSRTGVEIKWEDTPSTFIMMGLEIEDTQRHLAINVKASADPTPAMQLEFTKRCWLLMTRIRSFRRVQRAYMPDVRTYMMHMQREMWDEEGSREAESLRLFLPSDITDERGRKAACAVGLPEVEEALREAEALDVLEDLRQGLRTRTMTNRFRIRNLTGQRVLTRGQGILRQIAVRIHKAKLRYRYAWNALVRLRGHTGAWEKRLRVLRDEDVEALGERALTAEEAAGAEQLWRLGTVIEGGVAAAGAVVAGETNNTLSWIWYDVKKGRDGEPDENNLIEALRVEWCKGFSRMHRWQEDMVLVEEEMRRTIELGRFMAGVWATRATARTEGADRELKEGLVAYALEHVDRKERTCMMLECKWEGIQRKGQQYLKGELVASEAVVVELDDEEEAPVEEYDDEGDEDLL